MRKILPRIGRMTAVICVVLFGLSCGEDEDELIACTGTATVDDLLYEETGAPLQITQISLLSDCLEIRYTFQGCNESITGLLAFSEDIAESFPPLRRARLIVEDPGECSTNYPGILRVELTPAQVADGDRVQIVLEGWPENILYVY